MAVYLETPADPQIRLAAKHTPVVLPIRDSNEFWSRPDIELKWPAAVAAYADELAAMQQHGAHAIPADLHTWRLGSFAIAGLPGLPFASLGMQIRAHSPARETLLACNSGGYVGPIPTREAFSHGGYETWPARGALLGPGAGEFIVGQTNRMLAELWQQR